MEAIDILMMWCGAVLIALARVELAARLRIRFLQSDMWWRCARFLPSYSLMAFHPRYWHLWTFRQWERHLKREFGL